MQQKRKYQPKPQTLIDTARWRISPEAKTLINDYSNFLERQKRRLEKRKYAK